jgi:hypothetical protein
MCARCRHLIYRDVAVVCDGTLVVLQYIFQVYFQYSLNGINRVQSIYKKRRSEGEEVIQYKYDNLKSTEMNQRKRNAQRSSVVKECRREYERPFGL